MLKKCVDDLRKFNGLPPYDEPSNYVRGDGYFARWLEEEYPPEILEQAEKIIKQEVKQFNRLRTTFMIQRERIK